MQATTTTLKAMHAAHGMLVCFAVTHSIVCSIAASTVMVQRLLLRPVAPLEAAFQGVEPVACQVGLVDCRYRVFTHLHKHTVAIAQLL